MATHAPDRRRRLLRRGIAALLSWLGLLLVTAGPALQGHAQSPTDPTIVTFGYTGGAQTWTVPPNVTQVAIGVFGAQGGGFPDQPGGLGGEASAGIPVTPGDTITVMVGGAGAVLGGCGDSPGAGGFNGGGAGGRAAGCPGAGGGGATDVRIGGAGLEHRVLVAGGGGAVGIGRDSSCRADGGAGGGLTGGTGACGGGSGGNQTGTSGSGQRGIGGAGAADTFNGGGGGGGGYYGGAGGSSALGGGGGSGFGPAGTSFRSGVRQGDGFAEIIYFPGPVVTSISPNSGPQAGGTAVTITGTYLSNPVGVTEVAFGSSPAANVSCASTTQCTATSPPGVGTVSVRVSLLGQTSADTPADNFTYQAPSPSLSDVSPNTGPPAGGTLVTITGTGFDLTPGATIVWFGDTPATDVHCTSTMQCTAKSPPGSGIVYVGVQTPGGTTARAAFGYLAPPTVAGISPSAGPMPGGTVVTITGANLSWTYADTTVAFGNSPATNVFCASDAR